MPSPSLLLSVSAILSTALATQYSALETYTGKNWLDAFHFTTQDFNNGFVDYVTEGVAKDAGLYKVVGDDVMFGVDAKETLDYTKGPGRKSVKLEGNKNYNKGLFILDVKAMPGVCGMWPAFWSLGEEPWPVKGEIDIIEGVNSATHNKMNLHTSTTCTTTGLAQSGTQINRDCALDTAGTLGCDVDDVRPASFGSTSKGGYYAMEWAADAINIWFFPRGSTLPSSLTSSSPDTSKFGVPAAHFAGACDIESRFKDQRFIFTNNFCGDWAGNAYKESGCPMQKDAQGKELSAVESCKKYVASNPKAFEGQFWRIGSFKTYTKKMVVSSSSSAVAITSSRVSSSVSSTKASSSASSTKVSSSSSSKASSSVSSTKISSSAFSTKASSSFVKTSSSATSSKISPSISSTKVSSSTSSTKVSSSSAKTSSSASSTQVSSSATSSKTSSSASDSKVSSSSAKISSSASSSFVGSASAQVSSSASSSVASSSSALSSDTKISSSVSNVSTQASNSVSAISSATTTVSSSASSAIPSVSSISIHVAHVPSFQLYPSSQSASAIYPSSSPVLVHYPGNFSAPISYPVPTYNAVSSLPAYGADAKSTSCSTSSAKGSSSTAPVYANSAAYNYNAYHASSAVKNEYPNLPSFTLLHAPTTAYPVSKATVTTTYTSTYIDVCETGYTTKTTTFAATYYSNPTTTPTAGKPNNPQYGWDVTTKLCASGCGAGPTTVTVTLPCSQCNYATQSTTTTKVYQTKIITLSKIPVPESVYFATSSAVAYSSVAKPVVSKPAGPVVSGKPSAPAYGSADNGTMSVGTGVKATPSKTGFTPPVFTGAASGFKVGGFMVMAGVVAAMAL